MLDGEAIWQPMMFLAPWLDHLRAIAQRPGARDNVSVHLEQQGMGAWAFCWHLVRPFARSRNDAWGAVDVWDRRPGRWQGVVSASRTREHAVWLAARHVVAHLYGLSERTLRRRIAEADYWGERPPPPVISPETVCVVCGRPRQGPGIGRCDDCRT
jgi:hypothetical protein